MTNEEAWKYAIGIVQLDGLTPSEDLLKLIAAEKKGLITGEEIRRFLMKKYSSEGKE